MAAAGDRAGALNQARIHATLLREQLDLEPDPTVAQLADQLRAVASDVDRTDSVPAPHRLRAVSFVTTDARFTRHGWRSLRVPAVVSALAVAVLAAFSAGQRDGPSTSAAHPSIGPQPVFVAPFRVSGADESLSYLKEGMVELLSTRLADDSLVHAVDPGAALAAWRRSRLAGVADVSRPAAIAVARGLGASRVVVGSVVGNQSQLVVSASLIAAPSGDLRAHASVEGPADSITVLVDRLAVQLLAANAGEADRLVAHAPPPLSALREFLSGQAAYRSGDYPTAIKEYELALRVEPTFALAALQLALAADWIDDAEHRDRALALAWRYRDHLSERDKAHYPAPSTPAERIAAWQHAVTLAPDRADAWYELGAGYFRSGTQAGVTDARGRAGAALRRALTLEPGHARAQAMLDRVMLDTAGLVP
jgi:tetratricopeptide (TPR) repeat protein